MNVIDVFSLTKVSTRYEAIKLFQKRKKIYYVFKPKDHDFRLPLVHKLFNIDFSFNANFRVLEEKHKNKEGGWFLYTDFENYPVEEVKSSLVQPTLF